MAYITNDGARLIERARTEGRFIVFVSVRMNTVYKSDPTSLVQKTEEWYGEKHGHVVGCISHVSVNEVSKACDSKLAIQCNDNSESWKSLGIYARLDGEKDEVLLACESIENGEYKDVTIVELPVTLDGVVEDFGLSEGGGEAPANMMTTDTEQTCLSGAKTWMWENYSGSGSWDNPQEGDTRANESLSIGGILAVDNGLHTPLILRSFPETYNDKDGRWVIGDNQELKITADGVRYNTKYKSWSSIINATEFVNGFVQGFENETIHSRGSGIFVIRGEQINPNTTIALGKYTSIVIDSESHIAGIRITEEVLDISASVCVPNGNNYSVSGIASLTSDLSFDPPVTPADGQRIFIRWVKPPKQGK